MELLEGETLRERLERERLSARKAVDFAVLADDRGAVFNVMFLNAPDD